MRLRVVKMSKVEDASKKKKKKSGKNAPLTAVEKMEDIALTSRVTEVLAPTMGGLTDKTLTEFIIHLTEQQVKKGATGNDVIAQSQGLRTRLGENGAPDIPLSLCKKLLEWVENQSPRIKRWKKKQQDKVKASLVASTSSDGTSKNPLSQSFPGLAKPNLHHSVGLDAGFYEHSNAPQAESSKRGVSNLPAWMTKDQEPSKKRAKKDGLEVYQIYRGRVEKTLDFGVVVSLAEDVNTPLKEGMVYKSQLPTNYQRGDFRKGQRQGHGKYTFPNGDVYEGQWKRGKYHGYG